ncbi:MAG: alanine dehydrogenase [Nitrospirae bacterium RIFCSPHIGHO2_01_FULL_66_17]|nr:MAG: alanine dehydrogenase [Nitrospirae bacterium RIFCSPHIGHO2_01_FULL_66_17]
MKVGVPREVMEHEYRVGMTPGGVRALTKLGAQVFVERGAGEGSGYADRAYEEAGALLAASTEAVYRMSDLVVKVKEPLPKEYPWIQKGQALFTFLHLAADRGLTEALLASEVVGIAYETVTQADGVRPLLRPMSDIAGRLSVQVGASYLLRTNGGSGVLLSGIPGVERGRVTILGGGTVGTSAAKMATGMGARVTVLEQDPNRLRGVDDLFGGRITTLIASAETIHAAVVQADLVVGAVLVAGARTPHLVTGQTVAQMRKGSVIVDVSIDQGGCVETARKTTQANPVYTMHGVIHYGVANLPGTVPRTSTQALTSVTLPYVIRLVQKGVEAALREDPALAAGLNLFRGRVVHPGVAEAHGMRLETWN